MVQSRTGRAECECPIDELNPSEDETPTLRHVATFQARLSYLIPAADTGTAVCA